jgi:hypothetical protein
MKKEDRNAENFNPGKVIFKGKIYETGNRYNDLIELYKDGTFVRSVRMRDVEPVTDSKSKKPPIGLRPKFLANEDRMKEIQEAITRYMDANMPIPTDWIEEHNCLARKGRGEGPMAGINTFIAARYPYESEKDFVLRYNRRIAEINSQLPHSMHHLCFLPNWDFK